MWRVDRRADAEDFLSDSENDTIHADRQVTSPHALSVGDPSYRLGNVADPARDGWRAELALVGGRSPLLHFVDAPRTRIELSTTHPGGLARFITGKSTLLSSLIRDDLALRAAKGAAAAITSKGVELSNARGIDSVFLGIGIAEWQFEAVDHRGPVLLRPLAIRRYGRDFELRLRGAAHLNPELSRALSEQFQIELDAEAFAALAESDGSFKPNPVIDRLRGLTSHLEWFNVQPRLVVSSFADVANRMVADAADLEHPVLDALAGNANARWKVEQGAAPVVAQHQDTRPPETDTLLLDADAEQENVVAQIAAGNSVVVKTLPGTGGTQTIVNAVGSLVAQNKRVLIVSPRRASLHGVHSRLTDIGLPGFAVAPGTLRRDLIRSITRNEKAKQPQVADVDEALVRLRRVLLDYRGAIARTDPDLGVSVLDCLTELSRLALLPGAPSTSVRLGRRSVESLAGSRDAAADAMVQAATLGEFKYGPGDSPWYGAVFATSEEAGGAQALARRLHEADLPRLLVRAGELLASTRMRPFDSITQLGAYLRLLTDIRDTLDRFLPVVFDRSLSELVAATAPRRESPEMSGANRRRLRRLAKEYVRPGVHVADLHGNLARIQQQRILWQRFVAAGTPPEIPVGIADVQVAWQQVEQDLAALDRPLGVAVESEKLVGLPIAELGHRLAALSEESDVLHNLQERAEIRQMLRSLELDGLLADLASRHVPADQVGSELELAWWRSALDSLLEADRALLGANTSVLDRLEADFRLVDEAHASAGAQLLGWQLAENWKIGLVDWPDEAEALKSALRTSVIDADTLQQTAPHLSRAVAPVWLASPYEVDTITDTMPFDTVVIVDAGAITLAEAVGSLRRARQIVAFGDPVTQTPAPFRTSIPDDFERDTVRRGADEQPGLDDSHADSVLARLSSLLPTLSLTRSYRAGGEDLAELVNRRFYGGRIHSMPWAGSFLGHPSLRLDFVENGTGLPDADSGAVESTDAEVARVVELVVDHAVHRPKESLMVITASAKHVIRVQQAVLSAISHRPELNDFILSDRTEPFTVLTIDQAVAESRDRVVFSIGYGRTPHGRVLSDFGALGHPGGERLLAAAMTRARRSMAIVTCFGPDDLDGGRMKYGAVALADILSEVGEKRSAPTGDDTAEPMLVDLSRRLAVRGLRVALQHRGKLGLVTAHGGMCLAIETDSTFVGGPGENPSLRESLRLRPEMLRRLGWHYLRVHAFELFSDPDAVADRIAEMLGATPPATPRTEPITVVG
ncbi:MAG: hypothetical protein RI885_2154 [Actinomycetota bacterium]